MQKLERTRHSETTCWCKCADAEHRWRKAEGQELSYWPLMLPEELGAQWIVACERCDEAFVKVTTEALALVMGTTSQRERKQLAAQLDARLAQLGIFRNESG